MQPIAALTVATSAAADPEANALPILPYLPELIIGLIIFALYYLIIRKYVFPPWRRCTASARRPSRAA